jgi:hypothetical protein
MRRGAAGLPGDGDESSERQRGIEPPAGDPPFALRSPEHLGARRTHDSPASPAYGPTPWTPCTPTWPPWNPWGP